ncbi:phytanoyl-CoA dioxygenase family protein [Verrucomicrobia bacterium]|nr:phytanoyl-CoA dioxygenase family protein [Verrucomicrobiales bacterium]MDC0201012.1 phytanoyl-CoA dioxygenase family protein [Verrucomicrobiota bacterium]RZO13148.1 MAG: phytanoyl-CoA dioxygenase family protein [Verrucomicrobiaceae bacterium]
MATDLGLNSELLTSLFNAPQAPEEWLQFALNEEQVIQFKELGYLHGIKVLNSEQIKALSEELHEMVDPDHEGNEFFYEYHSNESEDPETAIFHALGAWRVRPTFHDVLWNPAFTMAAYQLLGKNFRLFHDQLFSKPAKHGGVVAWHQDFSYWTWTEPMSHLTCWIGLDDVDKENGCMYYIPNSHRWGLLEKESLTGDMDAIREKLTESQVADFDKKIPVEMKAGEASFHHPLLMHGSYENNSERGRRATIINVFSDGVVSNREDDGSNAPGADNYPRITKGEKMGGTYYPLLIRAEESFGELIDRVPTIDSV